MSSYICGDQTTMAAAEGIARCEGYSADSVQLLSTLLRMANETATGTRATGETVHQPVDQAKRRAYDDLEMIGSCECLAYQLDTAGRGEERQVATAEQNGTEPVPRRVPAVHLHNPIPHRDRLRQARGNPLGHRLRRGSPAHRAPDAPHGGNRSRAIRHPARPASAGRRAFRRPPDLPTAGNLMFPDLHRTPPAMTEHGHGVQRSGAPVRRAS